MSAIAHRITPPCGHRVHVGSCPHCQQASHELQVERLHEAEVSCANWASLSRPFSARAMAGML